jgi:hypothetical protein
MMDGKDFIKAVKEYFSFLVTEENMKLSNEIINGSLYYEVSYLNKTHSISISYENGEDYLNVIIFILCNDKLPNYDDKTRTLHLKRLNSIVLPIIDKSELNLNNEYFLRFRKEVGLKGKLLQSAKELRLCLKYPTNLMVNKLILE